MSDAVCARKMPGQAEVLHATVEHAPLADPLHDRRREQGSDARRRVRAPVREQPEHISSCPPPPGLPFEKIGSAMQIGCVPTAAPTRPAEIGRSSAAISASSSFLGHPAVVHASRCHARSRCASTGYSSRRAPTGSPAALRAPPRSGHRRDVQRSAKPSPSARRVRRRSRSEASVNLAVRRARSAS